MTAEIPTKDIVGRLATEKILGILSAARRIIPPTRRFL
jgi:hypothetical protein